MLKRASVRPLPVLVSSILAVGIACAPQMTPTLEGSGVATGSHIAAASPEPITTPAVARGQTATLVVPGATPIATASTPAVASPGPVATPSTAPGAVATPASQAVFLNILEPADESVVEASPVTIRGRTLAGNVVIVNGETADVDSAGDFIFVAALEEGPNFFDIASVDEDGNDVTKRLTLFYAPAP